MERGRVTFGKSIEASPLRALAQIIPVGNFEARRTFRASHAHANSSCDGK
jgi:hypothetical protein